LVPSSTLSEEGPLPFPKRKRIFLFPQVSRQKSPDRFHHSLDELCSSSQKVSQVGGAFFSLEDVGFFFPFQIHLHLFPSEGIPYLVQASQERPEEKPSGKDLFSQLLFLSPHEVRTVHPLENRTLFVDFCTKFLGPLAGKHPFFQRLRSCESPFPFLFFRDQSLFPHEGNPPPSL